MGLEAGAGDSKEARLARAVRPWGERLKFREGVES